VVDYDIHIQSRLFNKAAQYSKQVSLQHYSPSLDQSQSCYFVFMYAHPNPVLTSCSYYVCIHDWFQNGTVDMLLVSDGIVDKHAAGLKMELLLYIHAAGLRWYC